MSNQLTLTTEQALRWEIVRRAMENGSNGANTPDLFKVTVRRLTELVLTGEYQTAEYRPPSADTQRKE